jgi:hypothetical protein
MKKHKRKSPLAVSIGLSKAAASGFLTYTEVAEAMGNYFKYGILLRKRKRKVALKLITDGVNGNS